LTSASSKFLKVGLTKENHREVLTPLLTGGPGRGMIVNVSVDTSSVDLMDFCKDIDCHYIDTVAEPWPGFYDDPKITLSQRSNYALARGRAGCPPPQARRRDGGELLRRQPRHGVLVRQAGPARRRPRHRALGGEPKTREGMGGADAARRHQGHPHRRARHPARQGAKPRGQFVNTWSVEGFVSEGCNPRSSASAPTRRACHRTAIAMTSVRRRDLSGATGRRHQGALLDADGAGPAWLSRHPQRGDLDRRLFHGATGDKAVYRPTCHYAYHPCDDAVLSLHEMAGNAWKRQQTWKILDENEIVDGVDELGVLLYGHAKNAYWYGSSLTIEDTRKLAPYQNATGLQVTSAVLAGIVWMLENPDRGVIEADEMDFRRCLEIQLPYLGNVFGTYTDWTPLAGRPGLFAEQIDSSDPWQFTNVLVR
jgi:homospermidine synthase